MARPEKVRRVLLDASCLIGVIAGEDEMLCLRSLLAAVDKGEVVMVASTALLTEVLPAHARNGSAVTRRRIQDLLRDPATELIDVSLPVAQRAAEYRVSFGLKTWDAVHLATASLAQCDVLFVRDGKFPTDSDVDGVWVSLPYDIEGEHLLNLPRADA